MASRLGRRVVVLDVETESYGRTYAGRQGRIMAASRHPDSLVFVSYTVHVDGGPEVVLKPDEVRMLDR